MCTQDMVNVKNITVDIALSNDFSEGAQSICVWLSGTKCYGHFYW